MLTVVTKAWRNSNGVSKGKETIWSEVCILDTTLAQIFKHSFTPNTWHMLRFLNQ